MNWTHPAMETILRSLGERTGLTFSPERSASAELGIRRAMARAAIRDPEHYHARLVVEETLFDDLVTELTIGETYFFRESRHFEWLRSTLLPELRARGNGEQSIRIWSAGCASGEEAYSLAMACTRDGLGGRSHVLATDISRAALARGRQAVYTAWSMRGEGVDNARPYLQPLGERFQVVDAVRRLVTFEHLNLALDLYPSFATATWGVDLIFCRNVLIYFDRETVGAVARRLYDSLSEGGWLVTASSDPPLGKEAPFQTTVQDEGVFYQRPKAAPLKLKHGTGGTREDNSTEPAPSSGHAAGQSAAGRRNTPAQAAPRVAAGPAIAWLEDPGTSVSHVRALANLDGEQAERACAEAIQRYPFSTDLHYLRAVLLLSLGRMEDAALAARRVIYLDRTLALAHFLLGSILQQQGDRIGASRAYRNARDLASKQPPGEVVPLAEGETAGRLAEQAAGQLSRLGVAEETRT